ncbi:SDR family oxidoreductase [Cucumibacter marinus]|uniref:SDR family oxidoreductase n=1 Tax=Cucumibacter marinus TaxID=1121252 RepID=UPI0003FA29C8|nr:SDR family oxidoreductase [Cucumibacter marinus]
MERGRVAIVTGATSGIGRAIAIGMARAGYKVMACGRRRERLAETVELTGGYDITTMRCDIADHSAVKALVAETQAVFGRIDILVNNAARTPPEMTFGDIDPLEWRATIGTNVNGTFYMAQEVFKAMREQDPQGGRIINNGAVDAHSPRPLQAPLTTSKHAMTGLTKAIMMDGRFYNIVCSQIDMGNVRTDMGRAWLDNALQADGTREQEPVFGMQHAVNTVLHIAGLPLDTNIPFVTLTPSMMPYIGRG